MNPRWQKVLKEYIEALAVAILLALFIRAFIVQAFKIPSESMVDTLLVGDHLLVTKFTYGVKLPFTNVTLLKVGDPQHGDIIVFEYPRDRHVDYIKRVIGLPGDVIEVKDNVVYRNGKALDEPYKRLDPKATAVSLANFGPVTVPADSYFAMGDNRDHSADSRVWGVVPRENILGKALVIYWSWGNDLDFRWNRIGRMLK